MPWQTIVHTNPPIIETCYSGNLSAEELLKAIEQTITLVQTNGIFLLLGDCSNLQGGHDVTDLKRFSEMLSACDIGKLIKEAIIVPKTPSTAGFAYFWTFMTQKKGLTVKPFEDRQSALAWLMEKQ